MVPQKLRTRWFAVRAQRTHGELHWDEAGLALVPASPNRDGPVRLIWSRISEAYAYKRDCVTVDQIRIVFGDPRDQRWAEVSEDDIGFKALVAALPTLLPGFPAVHERWDEGVHPAFATQWTQIYKRSE